MTDEVRYDDRLEAGEEWLARRVWLKAMFAGTTTWQERRDFMRDQIIELRLQSVIVGKKGGKPLTYRQAWEQLYQQSWPE